MALAVEELYLSVQDYLEGEEISEIKHEYVAGRVSAMSGRTMAHQRISRNLIANSLRSLRGKPCEPTSCDFKVRIKLGQDWVFYYPDAMIVCEPIADDAHFTDSPKVILEVLSPSTRRNDEVQKFRDYLTIPSLQEEVFQRENLVGTDAVLDLPEVDTSIPFSELYRDVNLS